MLHFVYTPSFSLHTKHFRRLLLLSTIAIVWIYAISSPINNSLPCSSDLSSLSFPPIFSTDTSNAMSYPPNSPEIIRRSPQHGITTSGKSTARFSSSGSSTKFSSYQSQSSTSNYACTIVCVESGCGNNISVIPHGVNAGLTGMDSAIHIKARCKDCEPPVTVPV
jgi:hypothetical protein